MIGSLRGTVIDRDQGAGPELLVDVNGVGYRVTVTASTAAAVSLDAETFLWIHHHHWDADQKLYGFATRDERAAFEGLLAAHKVGPALALAILTVHPPDRLARVLADDDVDALCDVPGVGKKTAQRLLVELKSTLVLLPAESSTDAIDLTSSNGQTPAPVLDVREALANLGYGSDEIKQAVAGLADADDEADAGDLLKQALRVLAGG